MDLRDIFLGLQGKMIGTLHAHRLATKNKVAKGAANELQWRELLAKYLPVRYSVTEGFVLDCTGKISDQLDIIIYDRQYSPLLFDEDGTRYVPAESVYAVFEVKAHIDAGNLAYAGKKAASVRRLRRTSAPIPPAGGRFRPKKPPVIVAGGLYLVTLASSPHDRAFQAVFPKMKPEARLDLGCVLRDRAFAVEYPRNGPAAVEFSAKETALVFFFVKLLGRLQAMGTDAAVDF